jgi:single-stranded DNA-binding protein
MPKLNQFEVIGHLAADPEIKTSQTGKPNVTFTLNVKSEIWNRESRVAQECDVAMRFFVSGESANIAAKLKRGHCVLILGMFVPREYNGKSYVDYKVFTVAVIHGPGQQTQQQASAPTPQERPAPPNPIGADGSVAPVVEDGIPF